MRFCGHNIWRAWNCVCLTFYETCNAHVWQSTLWKKNLLHSTTAKENWHKHKAIVILRSIPHVALSKTLLTFVFYHKGFNDRHLLLVLVCLFHPLSNSWPRGRRLCLYFPQARQTRIHTDTILQNSIFHNVSPSADNHRHNYAKECFSYCISHMHTILPKNGMTHQARYVFLYYWQLLRVAVKNYLADFFR